MAEFQGGDGSSGTRRSTVRCGACKLLKRKCTSECIFAPYFGTDQGESSFAVVHKVFGALQLSDPVYGCVSTILALQQQVAAMQAEVSMMQTELMNRRFAGANALQTTHQEQHQMLQQQNFNIAVQPAYSNNPYPSTNNHMNMNNFNPGFDLTMETAPLSHSLETFQNSWFSHYEEDD